MNAGLVLVVEEQKEEVLRNILIRENPTTRLVHPVRK